MHKNQHPSDSKTQLEIEKFILKKLKLESGKHTSLKKGAYVDIDGKNRAGYYEVYAHTGKLKPAQLYKVMNDAIKLFLAARNNKKRNKVIIFTDRIAEKQFTGLSWRAIALRELGIKTITFNKLSKLLIRKLKRDRALQARILIR
jgi:NCAIR mutase (PurE)-related protein